jgi:hypothetical protein
MRPGPSIALKLLAGSTTLALSVRGWHSPAMAVLGGALLLRAGFDLERNRPTNAPLTPRHYAPVPPQAGPAPPAGRAAGSEGAARVAAWARRHRGTDPAQVRLDRDWLAAQLERPSATAAAASESPRPPSPSPQSSATPAPSHSTPTTSTFDD